MNLYFQNFSLEVTYKQQLSSLLANMSKMYLQLKFVMQRKSKKAQENALSRLITSNQT